jgi:hypothetical protein
MDYARKYSNYPELVVRLRKLKYLIASIGDIDANIDFELSIVKNDTENLVDEMSIYISDSFYFDGMMHEFEDIFKDIIVKMDNVFSKVRLDPNLNLNRTYENTFLGGMLSYVEFKRNDNVLSYEIEFILEI